MSATVRTVEPTSFTSGEALEWTRSYSDYPATLWTLVYTFRFTNGAGFDATATADGTTFEIAVPATDTVSLTPGRYNWQAWLTEIATPTNKILRDSGRTMVKQGFVAGTVDAIETRTANEIELDAIKAALSAFASSDVLKYTISTPAGTRTVERSDKMQLAKERDRYEILVANERARERSRKGGPVMQSIHIKMRG